MFKVKMYTHENGEVIVREKVFYAIEKAMEFYNDIQKLVTHGKLIIHNRITNEYYERKCSIWKSSLHIS